MEDIFQYEISGLRNFASVPVKRFQLTDDVASNFFFESLLVKCRFIFRAFLVQNYEVFRVYFYVRFSVRRTLLVLYSKYVSTRYF